mmetsp:Transcript_17020/g.46863  ORF Transcript_17020/g.46863 Transcript_17020/m.46863 type:complete len:310 (+) Transcript_17020:137-1066(+)
MHCRPLAHSASNTTCTLLVPRAVILALRSWLVTPASRAAARSRNSAACSASAVAASLQRAASPRRLRRSSWAPVIVEGKRACPGSSRLQMKALKLRASHLEMSCAVRSCHCSSRHSVRTCTASASASRNTHKSFSATTFISRCQRGSMNASIFTFSGSYFFMTVPPTPVTIPKACSLSWSCRASWSLECRPWPRPSTFEKEPSEAPRPALPAAAVEAAVSFSGWSAGRPKRIMPTCCREFSECSTSTGEGESVAMTTVRCASSVKQLRSKCVSRELRNGMCCNASPRPSSRLCLFRCMMRAHSFNINKE